ncbi:MAG: PDZ domain-containing protein [Verrucomicrobiota bacterium]
MKRAAQVILGLLLVALIGFIVWHDWLRPKPASPPGARDEDMVAQEEIVGIGAMLKDDPDTGLIRIMNALPNSPAMKAGLASGWLIRRINDAEIKGIRLDRCAALVRGPVGSKVTLELWNPETDATNKVELTRERIVLPAEPAPPG